MKETLVILSVIFNCFGSGLSAQVQNDFNWLFGRQEANDGTTMNFGTDSLDVFFHERNMTLRSTNASISNNAGELVLYSNGCEIRNALGEVIVNGADLRTEPGSLNKCPDYYNGGHQSLAFLTFENDSTYVLLSKRIVLAPNEPVVVASDSLFLSRIELGSNGIYEVVEKNSVINNSQINFGFINAVKINNKNEWWVISALENSNGYEIYRIGEEGLLVINSQFIGPVLNAIDEKLQTIVSPKGDLMVRAYADRGIYLYDFDRALGELSNVRHIDFTISPKFGGAAVSSNGRFLYINSLTELWQFDLEADDILDSGVFIAEYDGYQSPFASTFFQAQLGPDCKLYWNSNNGEDVLHVMHHPNVKGLACNFEQHGIQLPTNHSISLPYFPSYRLDTDYLLCDTTKLVADYTIPIRYVAEEEWKVFPNPTTGIFEVEWNIGFAIPRSYEIFTAAGQRVQAGDFDFGGRLEFDISAEGTGIYFLKLRLDDGGVVVRRIVKGV